VSEPVLVLSFALFVALALGVAIFGRRAGRILGETREAESFRRSIADIAGRAETSLGGVSERIDALRRHKASPVDVGPNLAAALDAVARYTDEARALRPPGPFDHLRLALVDDLDRAARALELVAHGCGILATERPRAGELEAQTSVKRGYLNVLHAREALAQHAAAASAARLPNEVRSVLRRSAG
jgi:hypothetical protein